MTTISTIGAGNIPTAIARLAASTGHRLLMTNSRGPHTLQEHVRSLGGHVEAVTMQDAVDASDIVVLSVPLSAVRTLPSDLLDGKVVIDTVNYYPQRDGQVPELDTKHATTSQIVAGHFRGARVVKGFNSIVHAHLAILGRPSRSPGRSALPIASDDAAAKALVGSLFDDLGYDAIDAGGLAESWRFERDQPAYCLPYAADRKAMLSREPGQPVPEGQQVTREQLLALLDEAVR
ncbi:NAD(P)-binding domain-containing protein [Leucobacter viscericola]|uniref:NAD(P)-binding domain-containing protein n=1 Tax=Leucobacter viscericola TaxID=2714935 RepID=A0A6G7XBG8_9MICO|nr:NAD(P)-binding domain-containing protein [Leucobacter viscericola]QIK61806.1 NAD(P)-binding domain-containing protein [Leucobacter viscericola]